MNSFSFTLEHKPHWFKGIAAGKSMTFYRWDKILSWRKNQVDTILSRWVINAWEYAWAYIKYIKWLLESDVSPQEVTFQELQDFFHSQDKRSRIHRLVRKLQEKKYKTWCELFIDFHTDKTCIDPFISISQEKGLAETFAQWIDEEVIRVRLRWNRILCDRYNIGKSNWNEFFVLWAIRNDEIIH